MAGKLYGGWVGEPQPIPGAVAVFGDKRERHFYRWPSDPTGNRAVWNIEGGREVPFDRGDDVRPEGADEDGDNWSGDDVRLFDPDAPDLDGREGEGPIMQLSLGGEVVCTGAVDMQDVAAAMALARANVEMVFEVEAKLIAQSGGSWQGFDFGEKSPHLEHMIETASEVMGLWRDGHAKWESAADLRFVQAVGSRSLETHRQPSEGEAASAAERLLTLREAAKRLKTSTKTIRRNRRYFETHDDHGAIMVTAESIEAYKRGERIERRPCGAPAAKGTTRPKVDGASVRQLPAEPRPLVRVAVPKLDRQDRERLERLRARAAAVAEADCEYVKEMAKLGVKVNPRNDRECRLAERVQDGDRSAVTELVASHQYLVAKMAKWYASATVEFDDLVQEGNIGLLRAAEKFKPGAGSFSGYAEHWVRKAIERGI